MHISAVALVESFLYSLFTPVVRIPVAFNANFLCKNGFCQYHATAREPGGDSTSARFSCSAIVDSTVFRGKEYKFISM